MCFLGLDGVFTRSHCIGVRDQEDWCPTRWADYCGFYCMSLSLCVVVGFYRIEVSWSVMSLEGLLFVEIRLVLDGVGYCVVMVGFYFFCESCVILVSQV